jgi:tetratricopeptide (TPR) repeat protein
VSRRIASVVLALLLAATALADRETAQFSASRGDKALAAKKFDEAEGLFQKALEEDATFLPAQYGLGQALIGQGKTAPAVDALRKFVADARATPSIAAEWKALLAKAEKQLTDLDAAGAAMQKVIDGYADNLAEFGQRWMTKDAPIAEKALRRALKLHPGHAKAAELLAKMGKSANSEVIELFNGKDLSTWDSANGPIWSVVDGELVVIARESAYGTRSLRSFEGDFDVIVEARQIESLPGLAVFAVTPGWKGEYDHYSFGCEAGKVTWNDETAERKDRAVPLSATSKPFDAKEWNTFEIRLRGNEVTALVNGEVIGHEPRPESRRGGFVGLFVQDAKVAFRKVRVEVR